MAQNPPRIELERVRTPVVIDADLAEWGAWQPIQLQIPEGEEKPDGWLGANDLSARIQLCYGTNHLYLAGEVRDDEVVAPPTLLPVAQVDAIELVLDLSANDREAVVPNEDDCRIFLMPMSETRPWVMIDHQSGAQGGVARQAGSALTGFSVAGKLGEGGYRFEAAIPFHQLPTLKAGTREIRFALLLHDRDGGKPTRALSVGWRGLDGQLASGQFAALRFAGDGPMTGGADDAPGLGRQLLRDLPFALLPLLVILVLLVLLHGWSSIRDRHPWVRPATYSFAALLFLLGLWLPDLWLELRAEGQQSRAEQLMDTVREALRTENGTLLSYRGALRDRAFVDLVAGKPVTRQKYTQYRFLSELAGPEFGSEVRSHPDESFLLRPYWLPLEKSRPEQFHFEPPLKGEALYIAVGRPYSLSPLRSDPSPPQLRLAMGYGRRDAAPVQRTEVFDGGFVDGESLGRDLYEVAWRRVELSGELRSLAVSEEQGSPLRLVGISLLPRPGEETVPLSLGNASLGGVLTDLRGAAPQGAGVELMPAAVRKVVLPAGEPCQKLWLFYRAIYPGMPVANPGERVAEVRIHLKAGEPKVLSLEHQVSMFYELAVHNTRDEPPEGSPAQVAFSWVDEAQEKHIDLVYAVTDLPPGAEVTAIEFLNLADYRMRFRSVVFGVDKAASPPDPSEAPVVRDGPNIRLNPVTVERLAGATVSIWRDGQLSETTLPPERRTELQNLPASVTARGQSQATIAQVLPSGLRRFTAHLPLLGDGWDGAVLNLSLSDPDWQLCSERASLFGLILVLAATPILLILFSELLTVLQNLRFRLMAVLSVASLVPLAVLSFVLAQVIERGHETEMRDGMQRLVKNAQRQLDDQKELLRSSAQRWQRDLAQLYATRVEGVPAAELSAVLASAAPELQKQMASQLPPEWRGGFMKLEFNPEPGRAGPPPLTLVAGESRLTSSEAPARLDPSISIHWGAPLISVRSEAPVRGGSLALSVGRPLGADFLQTLSPGQAVLLADARGYPLAAVGSTREQVDAQTLLQWSLRPPVMLERERAMATVLDERAPALLTTPFLGGEWLCGIDVLRDLQQTPRAMLLLAQPSPRAMLDLAIGRIPVRTFFLGVAALLVVLSAFLSFVVSTRISRPIERLELGALALARGNLATRVPGEEGGQIGRLTRAFNQMAQDLQGRLQDLQLVNRAMAELGAHLDLAQTLQALRNFCAQNSPADRVRVLLLDHEPGVVEVHGGSRPGRLELPAELQFLARASGPFSMRWPQGVGAALSGHLGEARSAVGLPLSSAGRCRGAVMLLFERDVPPPINLDLLATISAQAAVALENAQLYRHAVQDPQTGAFMPDYFRRRAAEEVASAQRGGRPIVLLGLWLGDDGLQPRALLRCCAQLREFLPADAVLCHAGGGRFEALVPGHDRAAAEAMLGRLLEAWHQQNLRLEAGERVNAPAVALVAFPEEAVSTEFLFDALRERLVSGTPIESVAVGYDETLQQAGVTAVSPSMREVYRLLRRVAPTDITLLLEGETGSGKEVLTNLIHRWSKRDGGPLVKVHCAALSETLLTAELFGHEKGAFTGADRRKIGKFEQANGGTIFLDEVGEIPLDIQVKLLRVLQEREIDRVGGTEPVPVDVRVIAATNRDIRAMVAAGQFREDLYYRLQGMLIHVPALRERKQEIPALVEHFRREAVAAGQSRVRGFTTDAMDNLFRRDWHGNIRELRNVVFRAMVLAQGEQVELRDLVNPSAPAEPGPTQQVRDSQVPAVVERAVLIPAPPLLLPAPAVSDAPAAPVPPDLAPRLRQLYDLICERGSLRSADHVDAAGVSSRTSLRDLQQLVALGLIERLGKRRAATYRPVSAIQQQNSAKSEC